MSSSSFHPALRPALAPCVAALAAAALFALPAPAPAAIVGVGVVNNSSPDALIEEPLRVREFATASTLGATVSDADRSRFEHRMAWFNGQRAEPELPFTVLSWANKVAYELTFTVEDAALRGYTLDIDSVFRGYVTARWQGNPSDFPSLVFASGTPMAAFIDSGSGFVGVGDLATAIEVARATDDVPFENLLVERSGSYDAGHFVGTRSFTLRYVSLVDNTAAGLQNLNSGEAGARFGLVPQSGRFGAVGYVGEDGEEPARHGHFVTVSARYDRVRDLPEPGGVALAGLGLLLLAAVQRRSAQPRVGRPG
jgi:hypothetical protein